MIVSEKTCRALVFRQGSGLSSYEQAAYPDHDLMLKVPLHRKVASSAASLKAAQELYISQPA